MRSLVSPLLVLVLATSPALGQARHGVEPDSPTVPRVYRLEADSDHEMGCFGPCACPVLIQSPMTGTFRLRWTGIGVGEEYYEVTAIDWTVMTQNGLAHITGSGSYTRMGGLYNSMDLNLSINGAPPLKYTSGVDSVTVPWSALEVMVSRHGEFCWDTLFTVAASPATSGIIPGSARLRLAAPRPSPFRERVDLSFALASDDRVELAVFEASGRRARTLIPGTWQAAGPHAMTWDGTDDHGRPVAAGVLFVRLRTSTGTARTTLIRVR